MPLPPSGTILYFHFQTSPTFLDLILFFYLVLAETNMALTESDPTEEGEIIEVSFTPPGMCFHSFIFSF